MKVSILKKMVCYFLLLIVNFCFSQSIENANIYLQEFHYNSNDVYTKNNNLIFYTKCYSKKELIYGDINFNDSISFSNLQDTKAKYEYYLRREYIKDTIVGKYNPIKYSITKSFNLQSEKKIKFKNLPQNLINYECDNKLYEKLVFIKTFFFTSCIIFKDEKSKKFKLKLLKENCEVVHEEIFDFDLQYSEQENFLVLKYKGSFIFVFDKYIFNN